MKIKLLRYLITFVILGLVIGALALPSPVYATTYTVNTTDANFESGSTPCNSLHCSLWEAVFMANTHSGPDRITFSLPGDGSHIIYFRTESEGVSFASPGLFVVDDETEIDATTQPGWPIYLHGLGAVMSGLTLYSNRNTIRGLGFLGFYKGLSVEAESENNFIDRVVSGDYLGGELVLAPIGNHTGIELTGGNNTVRGASVANNNTGILVDGSNQQIEDSHIGFISGPSSLRGNDVGIRLNGSGNTVERNTIIGNYDKGLWVLSSGNIVVRNRIGLDTTNHPLGNRIGISLYNEGGNRIGGTDAYEGNIIVDNDIGIQVTSPGNQIINNRIGTDFAGTAIPNRIGVQLAVSSNGTLLGSGWTGAGNIIAHNTEEGVVVDSTAQNVIEGNTIHNNGGHGIALRAVDIPPPTDGMKITIKRNSIYNNGGMGIYIPVAAFNGNLEHPAGLRYTGSAVTGRACPGCTIEVFEAAADPSGFGEGKTFLSNGTAGGDGSFSIPVSGLHACSQVTATATDELGNTSDFSLNANALMCVRLPVVWAWIIILGGGGAGAGVALLIVARRRPLTLRRAPWLLLGMALGIGVAVLLLRLPFVQIAWPASRAQLAPSQPQIYTQPPPLSTEPPAVIPNAPPSFTPTVTLTATATLSAPTATLLQNINCRRGPGTDYDIVTNLPQGLNVPIVGRNENRSWWQVQVPGSATQCWLAAENVQTAGDLSQVPIVEAEPLGCWVKPVQGPEKCVVPCPQGAKPGGACTP
jgi:parallel beta-helix repeat protein